MMQRWQVRLAPTGNFFWNVEQHRNIAMDMGVTKTEVFTDRQNKLAQMMKALGHPAGIAIMFGQG